MTAHILKALVREKRDEGNDPEIVPFTADQFKAFCDKLLAQKDIDLNDDDTCARLKLAVNAPVEKCEMIDGRTLFGPFVHSIPVTPTTTPSTKFGQRGAMTFIMHYGEV